MNCATTNGVQPPPSRLLPSSPPRSPAPSLPPLPRSLASPSSPFPDSVIQTNYHLSPRWGNMYAGLTQKMLDISDRMA